MSESEREVIVEAFLEEFSAGKRLGGDLIASYRALTTDFLAYYDGHDPAGLDASSIERYIAVRRQKGESPEQLSEATTSARAFVQFARGGGIERLRAAPPPATKAAILDEGTIEGVRDDLRRVWSLDGATFCVAVCAPLLMMSFGGTMALFGQVVFFAALAGTYFMVLDHVAKDQPGLPRGASENLGGSLWRGILVVLVGVLPPLVAGVQVDSMGLDGAPVWIATFVFAVLGVGLMPAAALAVYASGSGLAALAPHLWYRIVTRIPRPYARIAGLYVAAIAGLQLWTLLVGLAFGPLPTLSALCVGPVAVLVALAMAAALGGVVRRNRYALGL